MPIRATETLTGISATSNRGDHFSPFLFIIRSFFALTCCRIIQRNRGFATLFCQVKIRHRPALRLTVPLTLSFGSAAFTG